MKTTLTALPVALLVLAFCLAPPAGAAGPKLFLSWHAPYGQPRASDTLWVRGGDGGKDTLYLTFESGEDWPKFYGFAGTMLFRTGVGDSLSDQWLDEKNIEVSYATDSIPGARRMWRGTASTRYSFYDFMRSSGRLILSSVRHPASPVPIKDGVSYLVARVMLAHPTTSIFRWDQPICVEWSEAEFLTDSTGVTSVRASHQGRPFVSMNSPGAVCEPFLPSTAPPPVAAEPKKPTKSKSKPKGKSGK